MEILKGCLAVIFAIALLLFLTWICISFFSDGMVIIAVVFLVFATIGGVAVAIITN